MRFYRSDTQARRSVIGRIMAEGATRFSHETTAKEYFSLYEQTLDRPVFVSPAYTG